MSWVDATGDCEIPATLEACVPYPLQRGYGIRLSRSDAAYLVACELDAARAARADAEERVKLAKARLIHLTGGVEEIRLPGGGGFLRRVERVSYAARDARVVERETLDRVESFPRPK